MKKITTITEYQDLVARQETFIIFKHSSTCSLSANIATEVESYLLENLHLKEKFYRLLVIENRELANYVTEITGVRHESPQILIIKNNKCLWHDSHTRLKRNNLKAEMPHYFNK